MKNQNEDYNLEEVMNFMFGDEKIPIHELKFSDGTTGFLEPEGGFDPEKHVYVRMNEKTIKTPELKNLLSLLNSTEDKEI